MSVAIDLDLTRDFPLSLFLSLYRNIAIFFYTSGFIYMELEFELLFYLDLGVVFVVERILSIQLACNMYVDIDHAPPLDPQLDLDLDVDLDHDQNHRLEVNYDQANHQERA